MSGSTWVDGEVVVLISIWGDEDIQTKLDGATRNIKVFEMISMKRKASFERINSHSMQGKSKKLRAR